MSKRYSLIAGVIFFMICTGPAYCFSLSLIPNFQTVDIDDMAAFDLTVSGLGNGASPSIGAFSLDVFFDQTLLDFKFQSIVFSEYLGFSNQFVSLFPGHVRLGEVSFESPVDLNNLQPPDFTVVSFGFLALNAGNAFVSADPLILSDENGSVLADIPINNQVNVVPVPSTILLFMTGLAGLGMLRRKKCKAQKFNKGNSIDSSI